MPRIDEIKKKLSALKTWSVGGMKSTLKDSLSIAFALIIVYAIYTVVSYATQGPGNVMIVAGSACMVGGVLLSMMMMRAEPGFLVPIAIGFLFIVMGVSERENVTCKDECWARGGVFKESIIGTDEPKCMTNTTTYSCICGRAQGDTNVCMLREIGIEQQPIIEEVNEP